MKQVFLLMVTASQFAFAEAAPAAPGLGGGLGPFVPMLVMFGIIYFLMIRPQQKKAKIHQQFLTNLKRGDMVVTQSGIIGTVKTVSDKIVTIEIDGPLGAFAKKTAGSLPLVNQSFALSAGSRDVPCTG